MKVIALLKLKKTSDGGRELPVKIMFKPTVIAGEDASTCNVLLLGKPILRPGEACEAEVSIPVKLSKLKPDDEVRFTEGTREVATGTVKRIVR